MLLRSCIHDDEMFYDRYMSDFWYIMHEAERLFKAPEAASETSTSMFHPTLGYLPPLFLVATKCRDDALRLRALAALHGCMRREKNWSSCMATIIARAVYDIESSHPHPSSTSSANQMHSHGIVSEQDRVRLDQVDLDRANNCIHIYCRRFPFNPDSPLELVTKPWRPQIDDDFELFNVSKKSLALYGYNGSLLVTPPITCQCGDTTSGATIQSYTLPLATETCSLFSHDNTTFRVRSGGDSRRRPWPRPREMWTFE